MAQSNGLTIAPPFWSTLGGRMFGAQLLLKLTHMLTGQTSRTGTAFLLSSKNEPRDTKDKDCEQAMEVVKKRVHATSLKQQKRYPKWHQKATKILPKPTLRTHWSTAKGQTKQRTPRRAKVFAANWHKTDDYPLESPDSIVGLRHTYRHGRERPNSLQNSRHEDLKSC